MKIFYMNELQEIIINYLIEFCLEDIYHYMRQEDSAIYFGQYNVRFGTKKIQLLSIFYNDYIINENNIRTYLNTINWSDIIINYKGNIDSIIIDVREGYINYTKIQEISFNI